jgi:hypothetical protein
MAWSRRRVAISVCILGTATLAIGIGVATGAKLKTKSASTTLSPDEFDSVTAKCKKGQRAISGGFEAADFDPSEDRPVVNYASRKKGSRGWKASAVDWADETRSMTAFAYCLKGEKLTKKKKTTTVPVEAAEQGSATLEVKCKRGEKVVSGGYEIPDFEVVNGNYEFEGYAYASRKLGGRKWTVSALNYGEEPVTLDAFAYCREAGGVKAESETATIEEAAVGAATASCERGQRVISGGFENTNFGPTGTDPQVVPLSSAKTGQRSWTAAGWNEGGGAGTFTVYAYCEKK